MSLEIKYISPYLPYGLKVQIYEHIDTVPRFRNDEIDLISNELITFKGRFTSDWYFNDDENEIDIKLILRPLSDLTKEIDHNGERFVPLDELTEGCTVRFSLPNYAEDWDSRTYYSFDKYIEEWINGDVHHLNFIPFGFMQKLYEWHFDLQRLIEKGLAVDINTLNQDKCSETFTKKVRYE